MLETLVPIAIRNLQNLVNGLTQTGEPCTDAVNLRAIQDILDRNGIGVKLPDPTDASVSIEIRMVGLLERAQAIAAGQVIDVEPVEPDDDGPADPGTD